MKFNIGDVVNLGTGNNSYWIIIDIDDTNYSIKPVHNITLNSELLFNMNENTHNDYEIVSKA